MKFTRLRLSGFKSFVDATDLMIEPGLTGVIGPNGCGKSNLLEAMRWVMGENSFKNMRGTAMEDVIFAGTTGRPSRNHAEVTLVIDNADRTAPAAYNALDTIEVLRRIERDAGSTYRINGKEVRARDVQLLFADASTGSHSPALVRQGQIGQLIASKPINRRRILEEAAGITGLYTRRHEAELRLKAAETNMTRLDDVMGQIEIQLGSLKRQARQASRYKNLSGLIREQQSIMLHLKWQNAVKALATDEERLSETNARVTETSRDAVMASKAQAEASETIPPLREAEAIAAAKLHRLTVERDQLEAEERRAREQAERLASTLRQIAQDLERERHMMEDTRAALDRLSVEEAELRGAQDGQADAQAQSAEEVETCKEKLEIRERALDELNREVAALTAQRQSLQQQISAAMARIERLERQLGDIDRERTALTGGEDKQARIQEIAESLEIATEHLQEREADVMAAEEAKRNAEAAERAAREPMQAADRAVGALAAEAKALSDLLAIGDTGEWTPVLDQLTVEPGYETALGAALGDDLDVPVDGSAPVHWDLLPPFAVPQALPFGVIPLSTVVKGPEALARRLSQVGIVSPEEGGNLHAELKPGQQLVTREGAVWRWDGYMAAADAPTAAAKRLEQRNRLIELEAELDEAQFRAAEVREAFEQSRIQHAEAASHEQEARRLHREAQAEQNRTRDQLSQAERAASSELARLAALNEAEERITGDLTEARRAMEEVSATIASLRPDDELTEQARMAREEVSALRLELSEARAIFEGLRREAEARARRLVTIGEERNAWEQRSENAERQSMTLAERQAGAQDELAALEGVPQEIEARRQSLMSFIMEAEATRQSAADALASATSVLAECDRRGRETQAILAQTREESARLSGLVEGARERRAEAEARVREVLDCEPEQALTKGGVAADAELPPLELVEQRLDKLTREREALGGVNLRADEEAEELTTQFDTMTNERADLTAAIASLRQGIASLNREGRERMLAAFEKVNANFERLFTHLFGGGEAHLKLTESDDPLEAGLEIFARPPGKRLQVMSLLSGGEQALTAMSLIFAVFLTNPSPICVLDEVDAPLDDANVERFCDLMDEMARTTDTRFLIITHHALTMARMSRLFGVTMQERGVSTLVSVDLETAERLKEAS